MYQAGLVDAIDIQTNISQSPAAMISSITWAGYDFIDAAKNDSVWNKAKAKVLSPGVSYTFDIFKECLVAYAKSELGLP